MKNSQNNLTDISKITKDDIIVANQADTSTLLDIKQSQDWTDAPTILEIPTRGNISWMDSIVAKDVSEVVIEDTKELLLEHIVQDISEYIYYKLYRRFAKLDN